MKRGLVNKIVLSFSSAILLFSMGSCDFVLKDNKEEETSNTVYSDGSKSIVGVDDENGCVYTAGYRWSKLRNECIRIFEIGFRLNPVALGEGNSEENELEDNDVSCFVIFNADKTQAEIFIPNKVHSILLENKNIENFYSNEGWELDTRKKMVLSKNTEVLFTAAQAIEVNIINPNQVFDEEEL